MAPRQRLDGFSITSLSQAAGLSRTAIVRRSHRWHSQTKSKARDEPNTGDSDRYEAADRGMFVDARSEMFRQHLKCNSTTLAKKIVTAEIFMRLIRSAIMWYHATSTSMCNASSRRAVPRVASMSNRISISHDRTADQSHEYLGCNDFFGQGSSLTEKLHQDVQEQAPDFFLFLFTQPAVWPWESWYSVVWASLSTC